MTVESEGGVSDIVVYGERRKQSKMEIRCTSRPDDRCCPFDLCF